MQMKRVPRSLASGSDDLPVPQNKLLLYSRLLTRRKKKKKMILPQRCNILASEPEMAKILSHLHMMFPVTGCCVPSAQMGLLLSLCWHLQRNSFKQTTITCCLFNTVLHTSTSSQNQLQGFQTHGYQNPSYINLETNCNTSSAIGDGSSLTAALKSEEPIWLEVSAEFCKLSERKHPSVPRHKPLK